MTTAAKTAKEPEKTPEEPLPPILDLQTVAPAKPTILIDSKPYEIHLMGDYGIEEQHVISREQAEFDRLWETDPKDLKREEKKRLGLILDRLVRKALDAPSEVIDKLNDEQRKEVVQVFISARAQSLQRALAQLVQQIQNEAGDGSTSES